MAHAIGDAMTTVLEHVVTKPDLDAAIGGVRSDLTGVDVRLSARLDTLSARFDALSAKVDALAGQVRFIMAILVVLLALGLVDAVPRILG